jgi:hypothetical protein
MVLMSTFLVNSYDLDLDNRLSEETTVLVESYQVCVFLLGLSLLNTNVPHSCQMVEQSRSAQNDSKRPNVCSSLIW